MISLVDFSALSFLQYSGTVSEADMKGIWCHLSQRFSCGTSGQRKPRWTDWWLSKWQWC